MVKIIVSVLVSHRQLSCFYNISIFNFVVFPSQASFSACQITSLSFLAFQLRAFLFSLFLAPDHNFYLLYLLYFYFV